MIISFHITAELVSERIWKIGQHVAKLWARLSCPVSHSWGRSPKNGHEHIKKHNITKTRYTPNATSTSGSYSTIRKAVAGHPEIHGLEDLKLNELHQTR